MNEEEHSRDVRGVRRRHSDENVFARPNGPRENAETAMSCRGHGPAKRNIPVVGMRKRKMHRCALVAKRE